MKKTDLKTGHIVEIRKGDRYLYLGDKFLCKDGYFLDEYSEDLFDKDMAEYDIMKVYESKTTTLNDIFEDNKLRCIWVRREETNWKRVPKGAKIQVRNSLDEEWRNLYFLDYLETLKTFVASSNPYDEFTNSCGIESMWKQCRLHPETK